MGKLYKVGEYGEMKLGEFRKNIMQYTRNNLRSIIASSDPEIVEIAIDELTRRGEELKDGGIIKTRVGLFAGGPPGVFGRDTGGGFSDRERQQNRDNPPDRGPPTKSGGIDSISVGGGADASKFEDQSYSDKPKNIPALEGPGLSPFDVDEDIDEQIRRSEFINTVTKPKPIPFPIVNTGVNLLNTILSPGQKVNRKFFIDNVAGTYGYGDTEEEYQRYMSDRMSGEVSAYGNPALGQNAIDARGGGD